MDKPPQSNNENTSRKRPEFDYSIKAISDYKKEIIRLYEKINLNIVEFNKLKQPFEDIYTNIIIEIHDDEKEYEAIIKEIQDDESSRDSEKEEKIGKYTKEFNTTLTNYTVKFSKICRQEMLLINDKYKIN